MRAFVYYHPHTMSRLLYYQTMVCDYFNQYTFNDVYAYDRNFRQRMAALPDLRWDHHDQELVAKFLRTNKLVCFRCRNFGHVASACSLFPTGSDASFARPASQQPARGFHSLFPEADHFPTQDHTTHQARSFLDRIVGSLTPTGSATIIDASQCIGAAHAVVHTQNSCVNHADNSLSSSHVTGFQAHS